MKPICAALLALLLTIPAIAAEALRDPCSRNPAHATADDFDVARCQIALDVQVIARQVELLSQLNATTARASLTKQDLDAATADAVALEAQKATLVEWLKAAQADAVALEAQKATLVEWLKAAQAEAQKP